MTAANPTLSICLNGRVIQDMNADHKDALVLLPGHFDSARGNDKPALRPARPRSGRMSGSLIDLQFSLIAQVHT
jgi:hypothetical protein